MTVALYPVPFDVYIGLTIYSGNGKSGFGQGVFFFGDEECAAIARTVLVRRGESGMKRGLLGGSTGQ